MDPVRRPEGCRILLVEDTEALLGLMTLVLEQEGYRVDAARSAEEGMRLVEQHRYDLILTDYSLPGRTGGWLLHEAARRGLLKGAATLVVTADPRPRVGRHEVVEKPVSFDRFLPQIRAILTADLTFDVPATMTPPQGRGASVSLDLYISGASAPCAHAQRVIRDTLAQYDAGSVTLRVLDVAAAPPDPERVCFTPALVRRSPGPAVWVLGNLSDRRVVDDLLQTCGLRPRPQT
jgi:CheY-like chemotaxis protein